jgi:hypothetical protein
MCKYFISSILFFLSITGAANEAVVPVSSAAQTYGCLSLFLKGPSRKLSDEQLQQLIRTDMGACPHPTELRRDYLRGKIKLASLSFRVVMTGAKKNHSFANTDPRYKRRA